MNKLTYLLLLAVVCLCANLGAVDRSIWVNEDFSGTFPPQGWTISANAANWSAFTGASAGGTAPEARFSWEPQFNGSSYLISPTYDTTGETTVYLDFDHFVDWYANPFTIGVATRSAGGAWTVAFSQNPTANVGPMRKSVAITNADVGSDTFQFALYFSGNSYNIDYWYIDNVKLYTPFPNDLAILSVAGAEHVEAGVPIVPSCGIKNVGTESLTAVVSLDIYQHETMVQSYPDYFTQLLAMNATATVSFPSFNPEVLNDLYRFVFTIHSLEDVVDEDLSNNSMTKNMNTWTGAKQNVLLEIGTGGWCPYCPGAAMAADHFVEEGYNVAVIENHNGDPYATDTSNGRNSYYGISGFPTGVFDGLLDYVGGSNTVSLFPAYQPLYNQRVDVKTPVSIELFGTNSGLVYTVEAKINKLANLAYENLVFHLAITQSHIAYSWQGQTEFNFVNMMMVPDRFGTTVDLMNAPIGLLSVPLTFTVGSGWNLANCEFVAFVQNLDTKEVLQAYKVMVNDLPIGPVANEDALSPLLSNSLHSNYPNPFNPETTIRYSVKGDAPVAIEIYNIKGQLVKTLVNGVQAAGDHSVVWNGTDMNNKSVGNGVYYFKMNSGKYSRTRKMILMK
ncbi:MAG: hypothetical protein CVU50_01465 [Candidatus Cloacimonetes bacterium HGW-Cloacimonetes-3]|jgi:hypothetical protein|nr:MAG: hypothetical protein CVU50_01465 [Candidatus Cloacimonetes bacterium HGW-Cloacimonetes-3]